MSAIGPGDWVECVDAGGSDGLLQAGRIYQVRAVYRAHEHRRKDSGDGVRLVNDGLHPTKGDGSWQTWRIDRFRPIYRPKSSIIEQLKQPIAEPVRELLSID